METRRGTLVRAMIWNAMGLTVMSLIGLIKTDSAFVGGIIALINTAMRLVMYFIYERVWSRIRWVRRHG